ncbi:MAG: lactate utilization protein [Chloroflexota bacterium]|nr:lactate utilization protein [Chloroflexota bacterium]
MSSAAKSADNSSAEALRQEFTRRAVTAGAEVHASSLGRVVEVLKSLLGPMAARGVGVTVDLLGVIPELAGLVRPTDGWPAVTISRSHAGIAATGSAVLAESRDDRLLTLLCRRHLILLPATPLPGLDEMALLLRSWAMAGDHRYVTLVTGPSRTSDIERVSTIGVHGPAEVAIILVEEWENPSDRSIQGSIPPRT